MTKFFLIAASVLTIATGPALAREARLAAITTAPAEAPRAARPEQRYCVVETITGSRIPRKTCRTRAEWMTQGVDPLAKD